MKTFGLFAMCMLACSVSAFAQNGSAIKALGSRPKAGDVIQGVVRDSEGPLKAVDVFEVNSKKEVVTYTFSDKNGHFSFELDNPEDIKVSETY